MVFYLAILKCSSLKERVHRGLSKVLHVKELLRNISKVVTSSHTVRKATAFYIPCALKRTKNEMI